MSLTGIFNSHLIMAAAVQRNGTEAQKRTFLPRFATGELRGGARADRARLRHRPAGDPHHGAARRRRLRRQRHQDLDHQRHLRPTASRCWSRPIRDAEPRQRGMSLLHRREGAGLHGQPQAAKSSATRASTPAELVFDDYRVPADRLIGGVEGRGLQQALGGLELGRINVAARGVGIAQAALEEAVAYAQVRKTFGKPICEHQAIQLKLADMATRSRPRGC